MSSSFFEIHELASGEIILKRSGDEGASEPLVTLKFSAESIAFLGGGRFEVAKAMIEAGMEAASELSQANRDDIVAESQDPVAHLLH